MLDKNFQSVTVSGTYDKGLKQALGKPVRPGKIAWLATGMGVGYLPIAPGTVASFVGVLLFLPIRSVPFSYSLSFLVLLFGIGVYTVHISLPLFDQKDPSEIVIDEIAGMLLILFTIPSSFIWWLSGFILFRFFDITKPPLVLEAERLPGGWGVMADDLMAALYTILILRCSYYLIHSGIFL